MINPFACSGFCHLIYMCECPFWWTERFLGSDGAKNQKVNNRDSNLLQNRESMQCLYLIIHSFFHLYKMEAQRIRNFNGRRQVYNRPRVAKFIAAILSYQYVLDKNFFGSKRIWVNVFVKKSIFEWNVFCYTNFFKKVSVNFFYSRK